MTFRPWVILTLAIAAFLINSVLIYQEDMPDPAALQELETYQEPLLTLTYGRSNRRQNFETMGLSTDLAHLAATYSERLETQQKRWDATLARDQTGLTAYLCPNKEVPQPYGMLRYLVYEDAQRRYVVEPSRLKELEVQPWYDVSPVPAATLYEHFEKTERRKSDATLMAVSSALLGMEAAAVDGATPWSMGALGSWSYPNLQKQNPRLKRMVIEYFGMMHYLTERANRPGGICS